MMINRRMFLAGSASAAALAVLAACSTDDSAGVSVTEAMNVQDPTTLKEGGQLNMAITATIANWNASTVAGNGVDLRTIMNFVSPYFWDYANDGAATPNPDFLTSAEAEEKDGKTVVTLEINKKAVWGSGNPITADDFIATVAHAKDEAYSWASTDGIDKIESTEKESDTKLTVTFDSVYPDWSAALSGAFPKELMADAETFNNSMAEADGYNNDYFAGPFKVDSYDAAKQLVALVPNDKWWGDAPKLEKVTFRALDASAEATAFANSELDVMDYIINADSYQQAIGRSDAEVRQNFGLQWRHFTINAASGPLADKAVRQALLRACDRESIAASDLAGLPVETKDLLLGNHFFMPSQEGYQDNSGDWSYDVEAAKKLLDDAGWVVPDGATDGIREKDGVRLSFKYTVGSGTPTTENEGNLLQAQLKEVGMEMLMNPVESGKYFTDYIQVKNYEITAFTWEGTPYPMANVGQIYASDGGSNYTSQSIPEIDEYRDKIDSEGDHDERVKLTNECDKLIWENVMNFPIYERMQLTAVPKTLANFGARGLASYRAEHIGYMND